MRRSRKPSIYDANTRVSDPNLTQLVRQAIEDLPSTVRGYRYLQQEFMSKYVSTETAPSIVRYTAAVRKWLATERDNEATNHRLLNMHEDYQILPRVRFDDFVSVVRSYIADIIGDVPTDEAIFGSFSGGATTSRSRTESHPALKYLGKADITLRALSLFHTVMVETETWLLMRGGDELRLAAGNVLFTVPKTTEIDRCACKEPDLNMYMQKGIGLSIRRALRRVGIDLNDQSKNQRLARRGSIDGSLATLDLSSASDSISHYLVQLLLPETWFCLLDSLRSPTTQVGDEVHVNEMFSSMGNGFTFELESLLFYCITRAVAYFTGTSGVISVYGDDIICPSSIAQDVAWALSVLGFSVNPKKSFWEGDFRESCGGHYLAGRDVTPFYIRKPITHLVDVIQTANAIRKYADDGTGWLDENFGPIWCHLRDLVPKSLWGGCDLSDKHRLVTPRYYMEQIPSGVSLNWKPMRLQEVTRRLPSGDGGYLLWHNSRNSNASDAIETSTRSVSTGRYRQVPVRHYHSEPGNPSFTWEV